MKKPLVGLALVAIVILVIAASLVYGFLALTGIT